MLALGDTYLEVVSPRAPGSPAGRFLARRGGDGGYMLILQTADIVAERRRLADLPVRIVWETRHADLVGVHLHPRDVGGVILSIDEARPPGDWRWAGPGWRDARPSPRAQAISGAVLGSPEPDALAIRWSVILGRAVDRAGDGSSEIRLERGRLRFERTPEGLGDHLAAVEIASIVEEDVTIAGVTLRLRR